MVGRRREMTVTREKWQKIHSATANLLLLLVATCVMLASVILQISPPPTVATCVLYAQWHLEETKAWEICDTQFLAIIHGFRTH